METESVYPYSESELDMSRSEIEIDVFSESEFCTTPEESDEAEYSELLSPSASALGGRGGGGHGYDTASGGSVLTHYLPPEVLESSSYVVRCAVYVAHVF